MTPLIGSAKDGCRDQSPIGSGIGSESPVSKVFPGNDFVYRYLSILCLRFVVVVVVFVLRLSRKGHKSAALLVSLFFQK